MSTAREDDPLVRYFHHHVGKGFLRLTDRLDILHGAGERAKSKYGTDIEYSPDMRYTNRILALIGRHRWNTATDGGRIRSGDAERLLRYDDLHRMDRVEREFQDDPEVIRTEQESVMKGRTFQDSADIVSGVLLVREANAVYERATPDDFLSWYKKHVDKDKEGELTEREKDIAFFAEVSRQLSEVQMIDDIYAGAARRRARRDSAMGPVGRGAQHTHRRDVAKDGLRRKP